MRWQFILKELYCRFQDDDIPALGAQLTFYLILSFFPFLIFLFTLFSYTEVTSESFLQNLSSLLPDTAYYFVYISVQEMIKGRSPSLLSFGALTTLWSASNGINAIIRALNKSYNEEETRSFIKLKALSIISTILLSLFILFSFIFIISGEKIITNILLGLKLNYKFNLFLISLRHILLISAIFIILLFLYKYLPNRKLKFSQVVPGALFSVIFWIFLSLLFSSYVNNLGKFNKMYGSLGGIIVLLLWLYISSMVILLGGELNGIFVFSKERKFKPPSKKFSIHFINFKK
ncbi:YihY/virulence factor BrkB family protein [Defluviitalea phaphyphila]|uniref:YihY/virulence factor BrkB family protein n=1 Tax=Defluviitalea phaphyphila TaxID=1473580 RepID=UPI0007DC3CEF|nr:YihY/virulence factor BrkB family protein [Defluviitalea phaphyphila]